LLIWILLRIIRIQGLAPDGLGFLIPGDRLKYKTKRAKLMVEILVIKL